MKRNLAKVKPVEPELLGVNEAEIMTGLSRWFWRKAAYSGQVESVKISRRLLIPLSEIRRVVAEGTRPRVVDESERPQIGAGS